MDAKRRACKGTREDGQPCGGVPLGGKAGLCVAHAGIGRTDAQNEASRKNGTKHGRFAVRFEDPAHAKLYEDILHHRVKAAELRQEALAGVAANAAMVLDYQMRTGQPQTLTGPALAQLLKVLPEDDEDDGRVHPSEMFRAVQNHLRADPEVLVKHLPPHVGAVVRKMMGLDHTTSQVTSPSLTRKPEEDHVDAVDQGADDEDEEFGDLGNLEEDGFGEDADALGEDEEEDSQDLDSVDDARAEEDDEDDGVEPPEPDEDGTSEVPEEPGDAAWDEDEDVHAPARVSSNRRAAAPRRARGASARARRAAARAARAKRPATSKRAAPVAAKPPEPPSDFPLPRPKGPLADRGFIVPVKMVNGVPVLPEGFNFPGFGGG